MKKVRLVNKASIAVIGLSMLLGACKKEGCTDPVATNYNSSANDDDGSCVYDGIVITSEIDENIIAPQTFTPGNYKVMGVIEVTAAVTLQPGVTFTFCADAGLQITGAGSISAIGTAAQPIIFKGETQTPGFWRGVAVQSNNPNNQFDFVTVKDAGSYWGWDYANIYVGSSAKLSLKNSTVSGSEQDGLFVESDGTLSSFSNNTFSNNLLIGLNISALQVGSIDAASSYNISNGSNYINVRGGTLSTPQTWVATTTPLLIAETIDVAAALTINAGSMLLMADGKGIEVKTSGSISAVGTAAQPISVEGQFASAGYAAGFNIESNNPANKFAYVNMAHLGSYWGWGYATVYVPGRLEIDNCTITNSNSWAMYAESSSTIITGGATQTDAAGVLTTNSFTANGAGPDADCIGGGCTVYFE